jgi:methylated-DNA-[protein]-cysteine S-methyltransferase
MSFSPGWTVCESPIGPLTVVAGPKGITNIHFDGHVPQLPESARRPLPEAVEQLEAYFAAESRSFELDLDLRGTPLQLAVWHRLLEIPYGKTTTYGEIATQVDATLYDADLEPYKRPRVVGAAIGRNPVPVVVPCHRVIGADGSLTGYFGGLDRKRTLLDLEGMEVGKKAVNPAEEKSQLTLL